jgi:hypothetical protein
MFLSKLLLNLDQLVQGGTLVAERIDGKFHNRSNAAVIELSGDDLGKPREEVLARLVPGMSYFLEVAVARDLLATWEKRRAKNPMSAHEVIAALIYYAENKTFPVSVMSAAEYAEHVTKYLDDLFSTPDDFAFCNGVFGGFANNWIDVEAYSEEERVVTLAWHAGGIIGNGGFEYLFEGSFDGDPGYVHTAAAFKAIGATQSYAAFQRALGVFGDRYPDDPAERSAIFQRVPKEERTAIAVQFWDDNKSMTAALARYIRQRSVRFREILSRAAFQ